MLQMFYPDLYLDSAYEIHYEELRARGVRGLLFDIDNTLVMHGAPADDKAVELFAKLKELGMETCLISNNKEPRVRPFAEAVGSRFIQDAHKPSVKGYQRAMQLMGMDEKSTVFIGDQLFTDIYGAKRAGLYCILTKPIDPREEIQIVLKRYLEKIVLYSYKKACKRKNS